MPKQLVILISVVTIVLLPCGCAKLKRKFTPKRKPKPTEYSFYSEREYEPKSPQELYQEHYVLWHNWHLEMERMDTMNYKRVLFSANECLKHLTAMRDLLVEEKAEELDLQIVQLQEVIDRIKTRNRTASGDVRIRRILEKIGRVIINDFTYNRMEPFLKADKSE